MSPAIDALLRRGGDRAIGERVGGASNTIIGLLQIGWRSSEAAARVHLPRPLRVWGVNPLWVEINPGFGNGPRRPTAGKGPR